MENTSHSFETLFEKAEKYGKTTFELSKLKTLDSVAGVASSVGSRLAVILVFGVFILFANIAAALYLGEILGRIYFGFLIVSGFYLIAGIILQIFLSKWLKRTLGDYIITQVLQ